MIIFVVLLGFVLFFAGLTWVIVYFVNKNQLVDKIDEFVEKNEAQTKRDWSPITITAVKGTKYYSIIKTVDDKYFLVKHLPIRNVFKRVATWKGYEISQEFSEKMVDLDAKDFSLLALGGTFSGAYLLMRHFADEKDITWSTDSKLLLLYLSVVILGSIIGMLRVKNSIKNFEENYKIKEQGLRVIPLKIKSHQHFLPLVLIVLLLITIVVPLPFWFRMVSQFGISQEIIPRLISTIGKERKKREESSINKAQKYLYGEEANWTGGESFSEINNDYRESGLRENGK